MQEKSFNVFGFEWLPNFTISFKVLEVSIESLLSKAGYNFVLLRGDFSLLQKYEGTKKS